MLLLTYLKVTFSSIFKNFFIIVISLLVLPIIFVFFLGGTYGSSHEKSHITEYTIVDEDKTLDSENLIKYLTTFDTNSLVKNTEIVDNSEFTVIIPKGYSENIKNKNYPGIIVKLPKYESSFASDYVKTAIEEYHEKLYLNQDTNEIYDKSSLILTKPNDVKSLTSLEYLSISMIGFFFAMYINSIVAASFKSEEIGLSKRYHTASISSGKLFNFDFIGNVLTVYMFLIAYILFFRFLGISFNYNLFLLLIIALISSIFIVSIGTLITSFFKKTIGTAITSILMLIQIFFGGTFAVSSNISIFSAPLNIVIDIFKTFQLSNNFELIKVNLLIVCAISFCFYIIALIKETYFWRWKI